MNQLLWFLDQTIAIANQTAPNTHVCCLADNIFSADHMFWASDPLVNVWFQIVLASSTAVDGIVLTNRHDCCIDRQVNLQVCKFMKIYCIFT